MDVRVLCFLADWLIGDLGHVSFHETSICIQYTVKSVNPSGSHHSKKTQFQLGVYLRLNQPILVDAGSVNW